MLRAAAWLLLLLIVAPAGCVLILRWVDPPMTWTIWRSKAGGPSGRETVNWQPIPLQRMGPYAPIAVVAAEDQRFTRHKGFDLAAIKGAIEYNRKHEGSKRRRGGSTISQQAAKNVFLWQGRTWVRKAAETYFTVLIEMLWGKRRILEVYLNCAEMGDGVFGIEAAARRHFHKAARELTREEAALIAASLPAPRKHNVTRPGPWLRKRQQWVLEQMRNLVGNDDIQALIGPQG